MNSPSDHTSIDDSVQSHSALTLENSSINNSFLMVQLQAQMHCNLSILDSVITSQKSRNSKTGISIENDDKAVLHMFVVTSRIIGNYYGLRVEVITENKVEIHIDQCFIAGNGMSTSDAAGGVFVSTLCGNVIVIISSTILLGNNDTQIGFSSESGTTAVTVFNSTLRGYSGIKTPNQSCPRYGGIFTGECHVTVSMYFIQCLIEDNDIGIKIWGEGFNFWYRATIEETDFKQNQHGLLIGLYSMPYTQGYIANMSGIVELKACF